MREILKSLMRTLVLLVCSIFQVWEAVFAGVGLMFCWIGTRLENASEWLMGHVGLGRGKYEVKAIAE